jgi:hypothetical protein
MDAQIRVTHTNGCSRARLSSEWDPDHEDINSSRPSRLETTPGGQRAEPDLVCWRSYRVPLV